MLENLNNIKLFGISIFFYITFLFVIVIYGVYDFIKKHRVRYLALFLLINIIIFSSILFFLIKYNINEDRLKSGCLSIILVSIFMLYRAKHDNRGKTINAMLYNQKIWKKTHVYFFPQEFNNEELKIIEIKLKQIFDTLKSRQFEKKAGEVFLWIKRKNNTITIRLVNQMDYTCENISDNVISAYEYIKNNMNSVIKISGEIDKKIELISEFSTYEE